MTEKEGLLKEAKERGIEFDENNVTIKILKQLINENKSKEIEAPEVAVETPNEPEGDLEEMLDKELIEEEKEIEVPEEVEISLEDKVIKIKEEIQSKKSREGKLKYEIEINEKKIKDLSGNGDIFDINEKNIDEITRLNKTNSESKRQLANNNVTVLELEQELYALGQELRKDKVSQAKDLVLEILKTECDIDAFYENKVAKIALELEEEIKLNQNKLNDLNLKKTEIEKELKVNLNFSQVRREELIEANGFQKSKKTQGHKMKIRKGLQELIIYSKR